MPKLNKQEKEYAVSRITTEIKKIVDVEFPRLNTTGDLMSDFRTSACTSTLTLRPVSQILDILEQAILNTSRDWVPDIAIDQLLLPSPAYAIAVAAKEERATAREARKAELTALAQPLIDEIQLGQADASRLTELMTILKG